MRAGWPDVKTWRGYLKFRYQRSSRDEYPVLFLSLLILESNIYPGTRQNLNGNRDSDLNVHALKDVEAEPSLNLKEFSYYKVFPTVTTWFNYQKLHLRRKSKVSY